MRNLNIVLAAAMAFAVVGLAAAEDPRDDQARQDRPKQRDDLGKRDNPQTRNDPTRQDQSQNEPAGASASEQARPDPKEKPDGRATGTSAEYAAELKKCDPLSLTEKAKCMDAAKAKFGQM